MQYYDSIGVRHNNIPEYTQYLGYLSASNLYSDFKLIPSDYFFREALKGKVRKPYSYLAE